MQKYRITEKGEDWLDASEEDSTISDMVLELSERPDGLTIAELEYEVNKSRAGDLPEHVYHQLLEDAVEAGYISVGE